MASLSHCACVTTDRCQEPNSKPRLLHSLAHIRGNFSFFSMDIGTETSFTDYHYAKFPKQDFMRLFVVVSGLRPKRTAVRHEMVVSRHRYKAKLGDNSEGWFAPPTSFRLPAKNRTRIGLRVYLCLKSRYQLDDLSRRRS